MKHSCWLTAADPGNLLLELQPTHHARTFKASHHSEWAENKSTSRKTHAAADKTAGTHNGGAGSWASGAP